MTAKGEPATVVTGVTEDRYAYLWKIKNFLLIEKKGIQLESQKFEIETGKNSQLQSKWVVGLKNNDSGNYYFVYCKLLEIFSSNGCNELATHFTVQLRESNGKEYWTSRQSGNVKVNEGFDLDRSNYRWTHGTNWTNFVDTSGSLTIFIKLSILEPFSGNCAGVRNIEKFENHFRRVSVEMIRRNMARLLVADSSEFDVKIVCNDGKEFKCHKLILNFNSSVFKSMLESDLSEQKTGVVNVSDISGKTMEVLLQYMYTGDLLQNWCEADVIVELLYAAGKYHLTELLIYLDNKLGSPNFDINLSPATVISLLDLSNKLSLKKAQGQLEDRIVRMTLSAKGAGGVLAVFRDDI